MGHPLFTQERQAIPEWIPLEGISPILIVALLAFTTLITEDLACISAGLLVAQGTLAFIPATLGCLGGIFIGDILLFLAGKHIGHPLLRRAPVKWFLKEADIVRSAHWFEHNGPRVILASRFIPGTRFPTYVASGLLRMNIFTFSFYFLVGALLWTPLLVGTAYVLGQKAFVYLAAYHAYALPLFIGTGLLVWAFLELVPPLFSFRGRRLLLSSWRRKTQWEFWPPWIFYPPVVLYIIYLGLKHRCLTLFTASNPAVPMSGFINESKYDILRALRPPKKHALAAALIERAEAVDRRMERIQAFMQQHNLCFPIVLKPNRGQRGAGVAIVHTLEEARIYVEKASWDTLAQEYAGGYEFGIFYYRLPNERTGRIFSITEKIFPTLTGDGISTLEKLILTDKRTVCMAKFYLRLHSEHLYEIAEKGAPVQLVELGTHCRGTLFRNGAWIKTPALETAMDAITQNYQGFYFGRYDVKTPSISDLQNGQNFKIIELNGVTSEATHIYDPGNSLRSAYKTLMRQWRIAFEIGAQNIQQGAKATPMRTLLKAFIDYEKPAFS